MLWVGPTSPRRWGLDKPYYEQYLIWAWNLLRGDFGDSLIRTGTPVRQMIYEAIPVTARLNVISLGLALLVAIPAGIIAGVRRNSAFDYSTAVGSTLEGGSAQLLAGVNADCAVRPVRAALVRRPACGRPHSFLWSSILAGVHPADR